jgi:hypothetical protein
MEHPELARSTASGNGPNFAAAASAHARTRSPINVTRYMIHQHQFSFTPGLPSAKV